MKQKCKELPKARNPFVQHLIKRGSSVHGKSKKAERRDAKMALRQSGSVANEKNTDGYPSGQRELTFNQSRKLRGFESLPVHHYFDDTL